MNKYESDNIISKHIVYTVCNSLRLRKLAPPPININIKNIEYNEVPFAPKGRKCPNIWD